MSSISLFRSYTAVAGLCALSIACATARPQALSVSSVIPGAEGTVRASEAENENTQLDVRVRHLADPGKLSPPATTYVVWTRANSPEAPPQNIGALSVDEDLNGSLSTVTPLRSFELFITTEAAPTATAPTGQRLLWTNINR